MPPPEQQTQQRTHNYTQAIKKQDRVLKRDVCVVGSKMRLLLEATEQTTKQSGARPAARPGREQALTVDE